MKWDIYDLRGNWLGIISGGTEENAKENWIYSYGGKAAELKAVRK